MCSADVALAQEKDAKGAALEEIVVTARRREERLQSVPVAVTAIDENALRDRNVEDGLSLQYMSPSLSITSGPGGSVTLRGQGQVFGGAGPGVVSYLDEVAVSAMGASVPAAFFDLQNIQVLKGPQGTLFGRNTTGGAILFTSRRPADDFEGYAEIKLGDYDTREFEGALNVPLVAKRLLMRIAGQYREREGYTENIVTGKDMNNVDEQAARLGLTWRITDNVENYIVAHYFKSDYNGNGLTITDIRSNADQLANTGSPITPVHAFYGPDYDIFLQQQRARGDRKVATNLRDTLQQENLLITDIFTWRLNDHLTLKNIAHYADMTTPMTRQDFDASQHRGVEVESPDVTMRPKIDELQLQGQLFGNTMDYVVGLYYEEVRTRTQQSTLQFLDAFALPILTPGGVVIAPVPVPLGTTPPPGAFPIGST
ncbi:MAG: TonB-dependent receptor plug domain-containing protein, partial [Casimicrobiaceae bacterium]